LKLASLCIQNLEWNGDRKELQEVQLSEMKILSNDVEINAEGRVLVGSVGEKEKICLAYVMHSTKEMDELQDEINAQFLDICVPELMWLGGAEPFKQQPSSLIDVLENDRTGEQCVWWKV
jgi:chlorite dismutase